MVKTTVAVCYSIYLRIKQRAQNLQGAANDKQNKRSRQSTSVGVEPCTVGSTGHTHGVVVHP